MGRGAPLLIALAEHGRRPGGVDPADPAGTGIERRLSAHPHDHLRRVGEVLKDAVRARRHADLVLDEALSFALLCGHLAPRAPPSRRPPSAAPTWTAVPVRESRAAPRAPPPARSESASCPRGARSPARRP